MSAFVGVGGAPLRRTRRRRAAAAAATREVGCCANAGRVLAGEDVFVGGQRALSPCVGGAVFQRFLRDDGERWTMHVTFRDDDAVAADVLPGAATGVIGRATSHDGVRWQPQTPALRPNDADWWWFDTAHCAVGDAQLLSSNSVRSDGGVYFMFYHGGDGERSSSQSSAGGEGGVQGARTRIGLALSMDGEHWSRVEGEHPTGALLDVAPKDDDGFDRDFVASPQVLQLAPDHYRMYYHSFDAQRRSYAVGVAQSHNGVQFLRRSRSPILAAGAPGSFYERGVSRRHVLQLRDSGEFVMFFEGVSATEEHSIGLARSADGLAWRVHDERPVLTKGKEGAWDRGGVSHPYAVVMDDGSARLYYTGWAKNTGGERSAIGLALSDGHDWTRFERWLA